MTRVTRPESGKEPKTLRFDGVIAIAGNSSIFMSPPTPFGGRRDASPGRGRAGSVFTKNRSGSLRCLPPPRRAPRGGFNEQKNLRDEKSVQTCNRDGRNTGNSSLSQPADAYAAGAEPPRASMKNCNLLMIGFDYTRNTAPPGASMKNHNHRRGISCPSQCSETSTRFSCSYGDTL